MLFWQIQGKELIINTIQIKLKEKELIQEIKSDAVLLESALKYVCELKKSQLKYLCQYSVKELKVRLKEGRKTVKTGNYKTQSEMRSK